LSNYNDYTPLQRNLLFSATAIGGLLSSAPLSHFIDKHTLRTTFTAYCVISTIATLLIPLSASLGFTALFLVFIIQGVGFAPLLPMASWVTNEWAPLAMFVSSQLCVSELGWSSVYYIQGGVAVAVVALFYATFRDSPRDFGG